MSQAPIPRNILITGASGGIGRALALAYAEPGVTLALLGRNGARLDETASLCVGRGARVETGRIDVTDSQDLMDWVSAFDDRHPLDLVIANAGATSTIGPDGEPETWADLRRVFDTNLYGALATLHPVVERMRARGHGQIAVMSSLGAYVGMPISPAYSASKAALKVYGEALRGWLAPRGVGVTVICPGFVKSAMSDVFPGPRPFLVTPENAAGLIREGLRRNRARIAFPFPLHLAMWFLSILPPGWSLFLQRLFRF